MDTVKKDWMIESKQGMVMGIYEAETADAAIFALHCDAGAPQHTIEGYKTYEITDHLAAHPMSGDVYVVRLSDDGLTYTEASGPLAVDDFARALAGNWDAEDYLADWLEHEGARLLSRDEENAKIVR